MSDLQTWYVIYSETGVGVGVFQCMAEDSDHADEQCNNAYPAATILRSGVGSAEKVLNEWAASEVSPNVETIEERDDATNQYFNLPD